MGASTEPVSAGIERISGIECPEALAKPVAPRLPLCDQLLLRNHWRPTMASSGRLSTRACRRFAGQVRRCRGVFTHIECTMRMCLIATLQPPSLVAPNSIRLNLLCLSARYETFRRIERTLSSPRPSNTIPLGSGIRCQSKIRIAEVISPLIGVVTKMPSVSGRVIDEFGTVT